jgi:hypothetical protein
MNEIDSSLEAEMCRRANVRLVLEAIRSDLTGTTRDAGL